MPPVDGMIEQYLEAPYGYVKSIRIQINFQAEGKSLNLDQYAKACNYLLSCLAIDQLQDLIPMAFKKHTYRKVRSQYTEFALHHQTVPLVDYENKKYNCLFFLIETN